MSIIGNQFKTVILLGVLTAVLLWAGSMFGGRQGLIIALVFVVLMNFGTYWFSDRIVLRMYRAKPVKKGEHLYQLVKEVAHEARMPMPTVYTIPSTSPNAFATGRDPKHAAVACTDGIMDLLSKEELKGVVAHEMGHVKNRDTLIATVAATIAGVISYLAIMARFAAIFGGGRDRNNSGLELLALAILTPLIATIIRLAISRSREYMADETGARTINDPKALASALEKIHNAVRHNPMRFGNTATSSLFIANPFSARGITSLFSTHPPMEERVKRLRSMA